MKLQLVAGGLALSACSVLYNPNNLGDPPKPDAAIDAAIDAAPDAPPVDAPPDLPLDAPPDAAEISIMSASPSMVTEGTGIGGSRPALVILTGMNFITPTFTLTPIDDDGVPRAAQIVGTRISTDQTQVVLALQIPVLTGVGQGMTKPLHIKADAGAFSAETDITVKGLDELSPTGNFDTGNLKAQYSRATFTSNVHFFGTAPAFVRVASDITITAVVEVDGQSGGGPGAHGCGGGGAAAGGGCGTSGGGGGSSGLGGSPGGGGGFATAGQSGAGNSSPGGAGAMSGDALLVHLTTDPGDAGNRGNGGGGGGGATLGGGGAGGGGGGVLELTADGAINVTGVGAARAKGGAGTAGGGLGGGNGGGGSGGAIVIRSGGGIAAPGAWISAPGGGGAGSGNTKGGDGAAGRVRIDTTTNVAGMVTTLTPARGPAWSTTAPSIVLQAAVSLDLVGGASATYGIYLDGTAQPNATTDASGAASVSLTLPSPGSHTVCTTVTPGLGLAVPESMRCIELVYLP